MLKNYRGSLTVKVRCWIMGERLSFSTEAIGDPARCRFQGSFVKLGRSKYPWVIGIKNGQYVFWLMSQQPQKLPRELNKFSNIRSFDFSVMVAWR